MYQRRMQNFTMGCVKLLPPFSSPAEPDTKHILAHFQVKKVNSFHGNAETFAEKFTLSLLTTLIHSGWPG